jgi:DNA-binding PucR family transcriptional regulator
MGSEERMRELILRFTEDAEENMSPSRTSRRLRVHENTISNRIRVAQELLPHPIEQRMCELQVALRLIRLAQSE